MPQVQIRLGPVLGYEDFPMLEWAHGTGIDIEVPVEFLTENPVSHPLENGSDARRGYSFPDSGKHASGNKNDFHGVNIKKEVSKTSFFKYLGFRTWISAWGEGSEKYFFCKVTIPLDNLEKSFSTVFFRRIQDSGICFFPPLTHLFP